MTLSSSLPPSPSPCRPPFLTAIWRSTYHYAYSPRCRHIRSRPERDTQLDLEIICAERVVGAQLRCVYALIHAQAVLLQQVKLDHGAAPPCLRITPGMGHREKNAVTARVRQRGEIRNGRWRGIDMGKGGEGDGKI